MEYVVLKNRKLIALRKEMDVVKPPRYICKTSWFSQKILPDYIAVFEMFTGKMWNIPSHPSVTSFARTARKQTMTSCSWSSLIIFKLRKTYPHPASFGLHHSSRRWTHCTWITLCSDVIRVTGTVSWSTAHLKGKSCTLNALAEPSRHDNSAPHRKTAPVTRVTYFRTQVKMRQVMSSTIWPTSSSVIGIVARVWVDNRRNGGSWQGQDNFFFTKSSTITPALGPIQPFIDGHKEISSRRQTEREVRWSLISTKSAV